MTVIGILTRADGTARVGTTIRFMPEDTPKVGTDLSLVTSPLVECTTRAYSAPVVGPPAVAEVDAGSFTVDLEYGLYRVRIGTNHRDEGFIVVGAGAGPTDISALWVADGSTLPAANKFYLYNSTTGTWYTMSVSGAATEETVRIDPADLPVTAGTMLWNPTTQTWYVSEMSGNAGETNLGWKEFGT